MLLKMVLAAQDLSSNLQNLYKHGTFSVISAVTGSVTRGSLELAALTAA